MRRGLVSAALAASLAGACASTPPTDGSVSRAAADKSEVFAFEDPALDAVTSPDLVRFESERAFAAYLRQLERIAKKREPEWVAGVPRKVQFAQVQTDELPCLPEEDCPQSDAADVVVTAARAAPPSITNNQTVGVDEGDIVKQIGPFLLVLQDGRIFSIDTRGGLKLADRANIYRDSDSDTWYDEMLVEGDRVIVTAYSYEEEASEISVFSLDRSSGRLRSDGVFLITSDDYYDVDNYATRIVGDRLVIYTPYETDQLARRESRPVIRRWLPEADRTEAVRRGTSLFGARDIYRPVQRTSEPTVHTLSICPLGAFGPGRDLECRATAFIGPERAQMFVSPDDIFLWVLPGYEELDWGEDCADSARPSRKDVLPAAVFRLPVRGGEASVVGVSGAPFDQFSMDSRDGEFRALADWRPFRCDRPHSQPAEVAFLKIPDRFFSNVFEPVGDGRITALPSPGKRIVENRFADDWLVYGGRDSWGSYPPDEEDGPQAAIAVAVPVDRPERARSISLPHNIIRTERVGNDMVLNGYRDRAGLNVTLLALGREPHVASTLRLDRRFESEGRSHAFNSIVDAAGNGIIGIPTVLQEEDSGRWWWRSDSSDISFLTFDPARRLGSAGELAAREQTPDPAYDCEVSCIDWYGNSRPIFTDGRIFGLMGTDLVEARLDAGRIAELRRLDLTAPIGTGPR